VQISDAVFIQELQRNANTRYSYNEKFPATEGLRPLDPLIRGSSLDLAGAEDIQIKPWK